MPIGRAHILDDKSLRIEHVTPEDEGLYICDAENLVGTISARASLTVHCKFLILKKRKVRISKRFRHYFKKMWVRIHREAFVRISITV